MIIVSAHSRKPLIVLLALIAMGVVVCIGPESSRAQMAMCMIIDGLALLGIHAAG